MIHEWSVITDGYRLFTKDGTGRQAGGVELCAMEQLTCMELYLGAKSKPVKDRQTLVMSWWVSATDHLINKPCKAS